MRVKAETKRLLLVANLLNDDAVGIDVCISCAIQRSLEHRRTQQLRRCPHISYNSVIRPQHALAYYCYSISYIMRIIIYTVIQKSKPNSFCHLYLMLDHIILNLSRYLESSTINMIICTASKSIPHAWTQSARRYLRNTRNQKTPTLRTYL